MTRQGWQITGRRRDRQRQRETIERHRRRRGPAFAAQFTSRNGHRHRPRRSSLFTLRGSSSSSSALSDDDAVAAVAHGSVATAAALRTIDRRRSAAAAPAAQHPTLRRLHHLHRVGRPQGMSQLHVPVGRLRGIRLCPAVHHVDDATVDEEETDGQPTGERRVHISRRHVVVFRQRRQSRRTFATFAILVDGHLPSDVLQRIEEEESRIQHRRRT